MKVRKKPVEVDAWQLPVDPRAPELSPSFEDGVLRYTPGGGLQIDTLEGVMTAAPGDWLIRGVAGEFYPCKALIFQATYEVAA